MRLQITARFFVNVIDVERDVFVVANDVAEGDITAVAGGGRLQTHACCDAIGGWDEGIDALG